MKLVPLEPTQEMLIAARDWSLRVNGQGVGNSQATGCYQAMLAASSAPEPPGDGWRPIAEAPKGAADEAPICVLLSWTCVNERGEITERQVGEAYWNPDSPDGGGWWWANTAPGDYYADPISESIGGQITHFRHLPLPPSSAEGK